MSTVKVERRHGCPKDISRPARLSDILADLINGERDKLSTIGALIRALGDRAFPVLLFIFAAINVIPSIPGTSLFLGAPLVLLVFQRLCKRPVSLPGFMMQAKVPADKLRRVLIWILPKVHQLEKVVVPRKSFMFTPLATRLSDFWVVILSISMLIPLPFTVMLPAAAICLIAIGQMERDGLLTLAGTLAGVFAVGLTAVMTRLAIGGISLLLTAPMP